VWWEEKISFQLSVEPMATDVSQEINGQVLKFRVSQKSVFYANDM
jgi:hypothetical protein